MVMEWRPIAANGPGNHWHQRAIKADLKVVELLGVIADLTRRVEAAERAWSELERPARELAALEAHGVDNWEGYGDAVNCGELGGEGCDICG
ncbi:hypothetical protein [Saccharopolyspora shandongensis]|uniref:hypothetical protein n=1 Tax=Saccharopolyspora shandongensis TaxID=418495 RepID=UPI003404D95E